MTGRPRPPACARKQWSCAPAALTTPPADGTCSVIDQTQQETCSFTDLAHGDSSKPFVFTPRHANPDATAGVTAVVGGEEATAQFPVQISAAAS